MWAAFPHLRSTIPEFWIDMLCIAAASYCVFLGVICCTYSLTSSRWSASSLRSRSKSPKSRQPEPVHAGPRARLVEPPHCALGVVWTSFTTSTHAYLDTLDSRHTCGGDCHDCREDVNIAWMITVTVLSSCMSAAQCVLDARAVRHLASTADAFLTVMHGAMSMAPGQRRTWSTRFMTQNTRQTSLLKKSDSSSLWFSLCENLTPLDEHAPVVEEAVRTLIQWLDKETQDAQQAATQEFAAAMTVGAIRQLIAHTAVLWRAACAPVPGSALDVSITDTTDRLLVCASALLVRMFRTTVPCIKPRSF